MIDWFPIRLSFAVATAATLIALIAGSALAWVLARMRFPGRDVIDALVTLPLVLPPTVMGYYLLVLAINRGADRRLNQIRSTKLHETTRNKTHTKNCCCCFV